MVSAWAPGHATLFFAVPKRYDDPMLMGSLGGGFNFEKGVTTTLIRDSATRIFWNKELISGEVTRTCIELFNELTENKGYYQVEHKSELRIGYGLSTSGAGAIGTVLCLNYMNNSPLSKEEAYTIAHQAEILHHTGLGSVVGQIISGIELRLSQGGPGTCEYRQLSAHDDVFIIMFGPLKTSEVITSEERMVLVTQAGLEAVEKAKSIEGNYADQFIKIGEYFTSSCGLITSRMEKRIQELRNIGEPKNAMAMIGETLIVIPQDDQNLITYLEDNSITYVKTRLTMRQPSII